jgi:hypothetical protein
MTGTFTTNATEREVAILAPEAFSLDRVSGVTVFRCYERDVEAVVSELRRAGWRVDAGRPRVSYSSPLAYHSASSHIRRS